MKSSRPPPRPIHLAPLHEGVDVTAESLRRFFAVIEASGAYPIPPGELSVALMDDAALARVHAAFLDDPSPTDVITFPGEPGEGLAGEICVSVDAALREATRRGHPPERELALYLAHGWLHLAGLDDLDEAGRTAMRTGERELLARAEAANAWPAWRMR